MATTSAPGGTVTLAEGLTLSRMGYGAMQLAGPRVFGPPKDRGEAIAVLREAVAGGVTHLDTSDFYGPTVVNEIIKEALHPYPADLRIVTKVGALRGPDGSWFPALSRQDLIDAVHANLTHLGVDALDGFAPLQSDVLARVAAGLGVSPQRTALARLLARSPAIVLIPGTSSRGHLRDNLAAADLDLPRDAVADLDAIAGGAAR